ncbi:MAG: 2-oxoacid:acceptor oxidoreductase family protein [Oscillospiraceae bacterium]
MDFEIILAGFGGQGILFAGKILAYCGLLDEKEVSWLPSYGPEMRGGTANCSVCISDSVVGSPLVTEPNLFLAMNQPSYTKFIEKVKSGGKAFIDSTLISKKSERDDIECHYIPATQIAEDNGLQGMANIVLLGNVIKETGLCALDTIRKAFENVVPQKKANLIDDNMRAIQLGMAY